jgi:hypothetical protein
MRPLQIEVAFILIAVKKLGCFLESLKKFSPLSAFAFHFVKYRGQKNCFF